ncbi:MAG: cotH 3 [Verrucomicrobiales bacterium]|nr:cotH 3 [Verrucomicrobiales bacterium]
MYKVYFWISVVTCLSAQCLIGGEKAKVEAADDLFLQPQVLQLKIELPAASLESLKTDPKKYVRATLKEGGTVFADVGLRMKGNGGFQGLERKPSFTLKFNEFVSGEKFHGQGKLFFENAHQDPSYLGAALGGEIFRSVNVPAPRVTFARLDFDGKNAGVYVISEAINREFLSQYYKKSKGNLYEGANGDITDRLQKDGGDAAKDQADLKALASACREQDPVQRIKKVSALLDLERFISFAVVEDYTWNSSGYSLGRNNYRVYHDPNSNLLSFIPHGVEHLFGNTKGALFPEWKGLVTRGILATPEGQKRYKEQMTKLIAGPGKPETLAVRINDWAGKIRPAIAKDSSGDLKTFDSAVALLKTRMAERAKFLEEELKKPEPVAATPAK